MVLLLLPYRMHVPGIAALYEESPTNVSRASTYTHAQGMHENMSSPPRGNAISDPKLHRNIKCSTAPPQRHFVPLLAVASPRARARARIHVPRTSASAHASAHAPTVAPVLHRTRGVAVSCLAAQ